MRRRRVTSTASHYYGSRYSDPEPFIVKVLSIPFGLVKEIFHKK